MDKEKITINQQHKNPTFTFVLSNLDCISCADKIEKGLDNKTYVHSYKVEFILEKVIVEVNDESNKTDLESLFSQMGFPVIETYIESETDDSIRKIHIKSNEHVQIENFLMSKLGVVSVNKRGNGYVDIAYQPGLIKGKDLIRAIDSKGIVYEYKNQMEEYIDKIETKSNFDMKAFIICLLLTIMNLLRNFFSNKEIDDYLLSVSSFGISLYEVNSLIINVPIIFLYGLPTYKLSIQSYFYSKAMGTDTLITFGSLSSMVLMLISLYEHIFFRSIHDKDYNLKASIDEYTENLSAAAAVVGIYSLGKFMEAHAKFQLKNKTNSFMINKNNGRLISRNTYSCINLKTSYEENVDAGLIDKGEYVSLAPGDFMLFDSIVNKGKVEVNEGFNYGYDIINVKMKGDKIKSGCEILRILNDEDEEEDVDNTCSHDHNSHHDCSHDHDHDHSHHDHDSTHHDCSHDHDHSHHNNKTKSKKSLHKKKHIHNHDHDHDHHHNHDHHHHDHDSNSNKCIVKVEEPIENCMILKLTEEMTKSMSQKLKFEYIIEKIVRYFVPSILIISLSTLVIWLLIKKLVDNEITYIYIMERSISILVVSCPCAFGLAIPIVTTTMLKIALEYGILVKNLSILPDIKNTNKIYIDKTGTLTEPIQDISIVYIEDKDILLTAIEELEKSQNHPVAEALYKFSLRSNKKTLKMKLVDKQVFYNGVRGRFIYKENTYEVSIGNVSFYEKNYPTEGIDEEMSKTIRNEKEKGNTVVIIMINSQYKGIISLNTSNNIRKEASKVLSILSKTKDCYILSGDVKESVEKLGLELKLDRNNLYSEKSSHDKRDLLLDSKQNNNKVMMIGDGINDVLSLSVADFGLSFNANSQLNLISGDVVFIKEDLSLILILFEISKYTSMFIYINIFWAFFYNIIMIPFTTGFLQTYVDWEISPSVSSLLQLLSDLLIILTASLLKLFDYDKYKINSKAFVEKTGLYDSLNKGKVDDINNDNTLIELISYS